MTTDRKFAQFNGIVNDLEEICDIIGEAMPQALVKVVDHLDDVCSDYIASSSFCLLASIGQAMIAQGGLELSEDELYEEARKAGVLELY